MGAGSSGAAATPRNCRRLIAPGFIFGIRCAVGLSYDQMIRRRFLQCLTLAPAAFAQGEAGFASLFDGKTLDGWRTHEGRSGAFYVNDSSIVVHPSSGYPTWLGTEKVYENFDFRCEFFLKGWMDSGIYIHAPEHGPPSKAGMKINIFHQVEEPPKPESMGSLWPEEPLEIHGFLNKPALWLPASRCQRHRGCCVSEKCWSGTGSCHRRSMASPEPGNCCESSVSSTPPATRSTQRSALPLRRCGI